MNAEKTGKSALKKKIVHEIAEYYINFVYLFIFFAVFTTYRRLILAEYQISYLNYGMNVIKALILAKVIMIGDALRLGRKITDKPLMFSTLYRAIVFSVWVAAFMVAEHTVVEFVHGKGLTGGIDEIVNKGKYELFAECLVTFCAFIPFFAFKELERVFGEGKIFELFYRRRAATQSDLPRDKK